jgi:hypothetical protein
MDLLLSYTPMPSIGIDLKIRTLNLVLSKIPHPLQYYRSVNPITRTGDYDFEDHEQGLDNHVGGTNLKYSSPSTSFGGLTSH